MAGNKVEGETMAMTDSWADRRPDAPPRISGEEWALRCQLADCFNLFYFLGWTEAIFNHITVRVPGAARHYLLNPFGLLYEEVTPDNILKVDIDGHIIGVSAYPANLAGYIIHGAIHAAREDAHCVMHVHTDAGMAVACKAAGLSHDNFYGAQLAGHVGYHDFEGVASNIDERPRMVAALGDKDVLIMRNHGVLVVGPDVPRTFRLLWTLQRACEIQAAAGAIAGPDITLSDAVLRNTAITHAKFEATDRIAELQFAAMIRRMRRETGTGHPHTNR
ncbi:MAG TPA: class II aldolase/adducin family protein [Stellaceae bacterium]